MDEQEFIAKMRNLGYDVDGKLTPQLMGPQNVYIFEVYPAEKEKFNWAKCTAEFLKMAVQAGNVNGHRGMMDFTKLKSIEKGSGKLKVCTTGLVKAYVAFVFINKRLPYNV